MHKPINCFPGYEKVIEWKKTPQGTKKIVHNMYRGTDVGLGGYVFADPGIYTNVALVDVSNMHGASIIALNKFGKYTQVFADVREANLAIKHKEFDKLKTLMGGALAKYIDDPVTDWKSLRTALKLVSNSTFGISFQDGDFDNPLRDSRDDNDIVALRGALFMRTLQDEVTDRGFKVAHIKTDSIKIPNATSEIVQFCMDFAKKYDYEFEFECVFEKFCLINGSTYVGKFASTKFCQENYGFIPEENKEAEESGMMWTAKAKQFQVPFVFKSIFSHEPIVFSDFCETREASKGELYLDFNEDLPDVSDLENAISKYRSAKRKIAVLNDELSSSIGRDKEIIFKDKATQERIIDRQTAFLQERLGINESEEALEEIADNVISQGHSYQFVGRVGLFTPLLPGSGGGWLYRRGQEGKYDFATGAKGYRWMEAESVLAMHKEDQIDRSYYTKLVNESIEDITYWCNETNKKEGTNYSYEWFVSDDHKEPVPDFMPAPVE